MKTNSLLDPQKSVYVEVVHGACNRRLLDGQRIASYFEVNGCRVVKEPRDADILFLITCGVSLERESSSIRRIHSLKRLDGELIVSGCLPAINRRKVSAAHQGTSIPTSEISRIDDHFQDTMQVKFSELGDANRYFLPAFKALEPDFLNVVFAKLTSLGRLPLHYTLRKELIRLVGKVFSKREAADVAPYPIRISWGCSQKCAYCGIRSAVGDFRSKPLDVCLDELKAGLEDGHREIEIIADDVGAYGVDAGKSFPELLNSMLDVRGNFNMQIWNLSPIWFIKHQEAFVKVLQRGRINRIHYPVQSGSGNMLKAMHRYSDADRIGESVSLMKRCHSKIVVTTDIIVGFPGETDEDIDRTVNMLRKARFDTVHIFLYNEVPSAESSTVEPKVPRNVAVQRIGRIEKELDNAGIDVLVMA